MSVKFIEKNHQYVSTDEANIKWTSVTTAVHQFCQPFNSDEIAKTTSKKKSSKWYGMTVSAIQKHWKDINEYSLSLGTWYHKMMETTILSHETISVNDVILKIIQPEVKGNEKFAPIQKLENNCKYPEHFVYLKSANICGQTDDAEVINGYLNIGDFKTNKELKMESYKHWEKGYQMMKPPFHHLMDCNYWHYILQLSLYMYIILKHNPLLKPGKITIKHIIFEIDSRDKFDNPVYKQDAAGNFIVADTQDYEVPYLKAECITMMNWLTNNKVDLKPAPAIAA